MRGIFFDGFVALLLVMTCSGVVIASEATQSRLHDIAMMNPYEIDLSEIEKAIERTAKTPYSLGGFLEFEPILFGLDRDAAFYRLQFFDRDEGNLLDQYNFGLRLEGSYRQEKFSLFARSDTLVRYDHRGWKSETKLLEGFASLKPNSDKPAETGATQRTDRLCCVVNSRGGVIFLAPENFAGGISWVGRQTLGWHPPKADACVGLGNAGVSSCTTDVHIPRG